MTIKIIICFIVVVVGVSAESKSLENYKILQQLKEIHFYNNTRNLTQIQTLDPYQFRYVPVTKSDCFNFAVKAGNEAHISLSNAAQYINPKVKIIIGGWNNAASAVVFNDAINIPQAKTNTPGILNKDEYRSFWIQWTVNGDILVGKYLEHFPFLVYKHSQQLYPINFIGITCGPKNIGSWVIPQHPQYCPFSSMPAA